MIFVERKCWILTFKVGYTILQYTLYGAEAVAQRFSVKKVFLKILQNSQENTCARVSFFPATLLKRRLWHRCFPVIFAKFLRMPFLTEHLRWLFLMVLITPRNQGFPDVFSRYRKGALICNKSNTFISFILPLCREKLYADHFPKIVILRIHRRLSMILKTSKKVYEAIFFDM